jgi:acetolactate synthase-1/2/3 large subunit
MVQKEKMNRRIFLKGAAAAGAGMPLAPYIAKSADMKSATSGPGNTSEREGGTLMTSREPNTIPSFASAVECTEGHELILESIAANGVEKMFFCGGTDNFYLMESVAKFKALGKPTPELVTVLHESDAVYMNMGYFQWSGRPQVTMLHVDSGTINAGAAWPEAWQANAGIVVMAGRTPWTTKNELRGGRSYFIHWEQEVYDQAAIVRQYTKWDYEIKTLENAALVIQSAFRIAGTEPCGPAYLTIPREIMAAKLNTGLCYSPDDFPPAAPPQADSMALREAARLLVEAENPVILVKSMGRHPEAVASLVDLAEKLSIPVASTDTFMNFPKRHWARSEGEIQNRDVILIIDHDIPWFAGDPPASARIISMDTDPVRLKQPLWGFPVHVPVTCDSSKAIPLLVQMAEEFITERRKKAFVERKTALQAAKKEADERLRAEIEKSKTAFPISPAWIRECVNRVSDEDTVLLRDISPIGQGDRTPPGHVFAQYAANLGNSWPRGIGIKMAAPEKTVVASGGDGCAIFSNPEAALWTSRKYSAPILYIINNNHMYNAVQIGLDEYGGAASYAGKAGFNGSDLSPSPDFAMIARAMGAYGEKVAEPDKLPGALRRALEAVKSGQPAVLDVVTVRET